MCIPISNHIHEQNDYPLSSTTHYRRFPKNRRPHKRDRHHHRLVAMENPHVPEDTATQATPCASPPGSPRPLEAVIPSLPETSDQTGFSSDIQNDDSTTPTQVENPIPPVANRIPTPPPLPPITAQKHSRQDSSSGKVPLTIGSSSDSEGRHLCPNGTSYPPLDELLRFGRVTSQQLNEATEHFDSEKFHCMSHWICEGIYHISNLSSSEHIVTEDLVPLSRNNFASNLRECIDSHLRSTLKISNGLATQSKTRTREVRTNTLQLRRSQTQPRPPPPPSTSEKSDPSYDASVSLPEQLPRHTNTSSDDWSNNELSSPIRQRNLRNRMKDQDSDHETVKPTKGLTSRHFKPTKKLQDDMANALEICSLPLLFPNLRLTFLHYIHQSLYSLHLRTHVKTQSYPKPDILELLIIGRDLCDQRSRYTRDIRHPQLLKLFLRELFSRGRRKVRTNCFQVPMLIEGHTLTSSLALEAFTTFHQTYQVMWNHHFGQMIVPPFI
jgi:hypothetical protein